MNKYIILFSILLTSCSSIDSSKSEEASEEQVQINSYPQTERERILESYRLMRARKWNEIKNARVQRRSTYNNRSEYRKVTITPKPPEKKVEIVIKYVDEGEQQVEIEQNLIYFCMNKRTAQNFEDESLCEEHTKNIYDKCLDDFEQGDARLTHCIKSRLR